jgi:hypothetical protein
MGVASTGALRLPLGTLFQLPGDARQDLSCCVEILWGHSRQHALDGSLDRWTLRAADPPAPGGEMEPSPPFVDRIDRPLDQALMLEALQDAGDGALVQVQGGCDVLRSHSGPRGDHPDGEALRTRDAQLAGEPLRSPLELMVERPEEAEELENRVAGAVVS